MIQVSSGDQSGSTSVVINYTELVKDVMVKTFYYIHENGPAWHSNLDGYLSELQSIF